MAKEPASRRSSPIWAPSLIENDARLPLSLGTAERGAARGAEVFVADLRDCAVTRHAARAIMSYPSRIGRHLFRFREIPHFRASSEMSKHQIRSFLR